MPKRKKACTECRQQKAKCDVYLDPEQPCSRCRKVKAHCVICEPFRREPKRQRLSQLQEEVEELRRGPTTSVGSRSSLDAQLEVQERTSPVLDELGPVIPGPEPSLTTEGDSADRTKPRILNGVNVSGEEIDDLFQVYVGLSIACVGRPMVVLIECQASSDTMPHSFLFWIRRHAPMHIMRKLQCCFGR